MEFKVIKEEKSELEFEIIGEDDTFCNSLRTVLNKNKNVLSATYRIDHPLLASPQMLVHTKEVSNIKIPERMVQLSDVKGVAEKREKQLRKAGIKTANSLSKADPEKLSKKSGLSLAVVTDLVKEASKINFFKGSIPREILKEALDDLAKGFRAIKLKGA